MNLVADLHCHTIASEHAYSTIQELVGSAKEKGIEMIAVTDHGIALEKGPTLYYFVNLSVIPEVINGVRVLKGVEANIMDFEGTLDMPDGILKKLDIVVASFHDLFIEPGTVEQNTNAVIKAIQNPLVHIIGHPDNPLFPVDIEKVVIAAKEHNKLIELNNKSYYVRKGAEKYTAEFAKTAKKYGAMLSCCSDAHVSFEIGEFEIIRNIIKEYDIPESLIINTSKDKVLEYLKISH